MPYENEIVSMYTNIYVYMEIFTNEANFMFRNVHPPLNPTSSVGQALDLHAGGNRFYLCSTCSMLKDIDYMF